MTGHYLNWWWSSLLAHIDGLMQERRNSIANAMELRLSCTNPSIYTASLDLNEWTEGAVTEHVSVMELDLRQSSRLLRSVSSQWRDAVTSLSTNGKACWHYPDSKVHGANMGPNWVLSAPVGPHVGPMNLAIWVASFVAGSYPRSNTWHSCWGKHRKLWLMYIA